MPTGQLDRLHKFVTLDALRGIAAIVVVFFHIYRIGIPSLFPHGYLAVDFFFMLSGFVLTYAYQDRLDTGLSTFAFLKMRVARLYPLFGLGMVLGILFFLARDYLGKGGSYVSIKVLVSLATSGFLLLPVAGPLTTVFDLAFPLNKPAWSLFDELAVNTFHALLGRRRSTAILLFVVTLAWAGTVASTLRYGSMDFGAYRSQVLPAIVRTIFGYTVGIILLRFWRIGKWCPRSSFLVPCIMLVAVFMVHVPLRWTAFYDLGVTSVVMPFILLFGASSAPPAALVVPFEKLGLASYAIYIIHFPLFGFFGQIWAHLTGRAAEDYAPWSGMLFVVLILGAAITADQFYDLPARAFLRRILLPGRARS